MLVPELIMLGIVWGHCSRPSIFITLSHFKVGLATCIIGKNMDSEMFG